MIPSVGRIVHYRLSLADRDAITNERLAAALRGLGRRGNDVREGDMFPMLITRIWMPQPDERACVQGQVFLDGNDTHWASSVVQGEGPGEWHEPPRVHG